MKAKLLLTAVLGALATAATAGPRLPDGETAIPFVRSTGVIEWRVVADDALYIRGGNNQWYFVRTASLCPRLYPASSLGFVTSAGDQLDRYGAIIAEGKRCSVASVKKSGPPPPEKRRR